MLEIMTFAVINVLFLKFPIVFLIFLVSPQSFVIRAWIR